MDNILEQLDDIPWASLTHAYGAASDVPELLLDLMSDDGNTRDEAQYELFGNIWHQGTIYEATIYAVPFLRELLIMPDLRERDMVLLLFASIAEGRGYFEVHASDFSGEAVWRKILAEQGTSLEAKLEQERNIVTAVRHEVAQGLHLLIPALQAEEAEIRGTAASALQFYPAEKHRTMEPLKTALEVELDDEVREYMRKSLNVLSAEPIEQLALF